MGGCRCTFRDCDAKSGDGQTHLFHYPVFDKHRCHQWLVNAKKLDFLNLTVAQLKNRVVCQHHFRGDDFMNTRKDKLKPSAIPVLLGPYCTQDDDSDSEVYPISSEHIDMENHDDKKKNLSLKYGNFLTNCDFMDENVMAGLTNNIQKKKAPKMNPDPCIVDVKSISKEISIPPNDVPQVPPQLYQDSSYQVAPNLVADPYADLQYTIIPLDQIETPVIHYNNQNLPDNNLENTPSVHTHSNKKVNILNEEKLSQWPWKEPLNTADLRLVDVKEKIVLPVEYDKKTINQTLNTSEILTAERNNSLLKENHNSLLKENHNSLLKENQNTPKRQMSSPGKKSKMLTPKTRAKSNSLLAAQIEEKRKFNVKLRDVVRNCLDQLTAQDSSDINKVREELQANQSKVDEAVQVNMGDLASANAYHQLDSRMKRMENLLLNRIDANTQEIFDLKGVVLENMEKQEERMAGAVESKRQESEEGKKKRLYKELSQYLSSDTNSLLYEELFINKITKSVPPYTRSKRKRKL